MPHGAFDIARRHAIAEAAAEPLDLRPGLRIAACHMKRNRLDQGERPNTDPPRARQPQRNHASIRVRDDMRATRLMLNQRLDQPQLVVEAEDVPIRPGIGASIADEIGRDQAKARLQRIDHRRPHRR